MGVKKNTRKAESAIPNKMEVMGEQGNAGIEKWETLKVRSSQSIRSHTVKGEQKLIK